VGGRGGGGGGGGGGWVEGGAGTESEREWGVGSVRWV